MAIVLIPKADEQADEASHRYMAEYLNHRVQVCCCYCNRLDHAA
jgi:hypothetical protein